MNKYKLPNNWFDRKVVNANCGIPQISDDAKDVIENVCNKCHFRTTMWNTDMCGGIPAPLVRAIEHCVDCEKYRATKGVNNA